MGVIFLYATAPSNQAAQEISQALVENRLAACVNLIPGMTSIYRWEGRIERAEEIVMIVKTTSGEAADARDFILSRHPYATAAVAAITIDEAHSSRAFCDWIREQCSPAPPATLY